MDTQVKHLRRRDFDVEYIANHCISGVSISEKAVHQDEPDRTLNGDDRVTLMNSESTSSSDGTVDGKDPWRRRRSLRLY